MANYKIHIIFGFVFFATIYILDKFYLHFLNFKLEDMLLFAPILAFMATIPDADHRESIPRLVLTVLGIVVLLYFVWFSMRTEALIMGALLLVLWILPKFKGWGHRGHFHSFIMVFIFSLPLLYFSGLTLFILGFLFALSHLIIDQFTGKTPTLKIF